MIKWLTLKQVSNECGFKDSRTFKAHYMRKYPPDRQIGNRKWWKHTTVDFIIKTKFPDRYKEEK